MLEKLTEEQKALMPVVKNEWVNFCLGGDSSIDKKKITEGVHWAYAKTKLPPPRFIVFAEGPFAAQLIANVFPQVCKAIPIKLDRASVRASVGNSVQNSVRASVWDSVEASAGVSVRASVRNSVGASVGNSVGASVGNSMQNSVGASVWNSVWDSVGVSVWASVRDSVQNSVWASVWNSVRDSVQNSVWDSVGDSKLAWEGSWVGLGDDAGWNAFYDYFIRIGVIKHEEFSKYMDWIKGGAWEFLWFKDLCIVVCRPSEIKKNIRGQLHCSDGPSAKWPSGETYWFLNGIRMKESDVMTPAEKLDPKEILKRENVDERRELIRKVGIERMLSVLKSKTLDAVGDYSLLSIDLSNQVKDARYLKMKNASIGIWHLEGVARGCKTVQESLNWRAGDIKKEWKPVQLT